MNIAGIAAVVTALRCARLPFGFIVLYSTIVADLFKVDYSRYGLMELTIQEAQR